MTTRRGRLATYVVVFIAVLAAGCQIRQDVTISFDTASSGQISFGVLLDEEALAAAGGGAAISSAMEDISADGWSTSPDQEPGFSGFTATASFKDQAEFASLVDDLAGQQAPFSELSYRVVDDLATFRAAMPTSTQYAGLVDFVFTMVVDMPGQIERSSAGTVEGSRVTWILSSAQRLSPTERLTVTSGIDESAVSAVGSWLVILAIFVLSILGLVSYAMWRTDAQTIRSPHHAPATPRHDAVNAFVNPRGPAASRSLTVKHSLQSTGGFCGSCGTPHHADDRFCATCGGSAEPVAGRDTERA